MTNIAAMLITWR